MTTKERLHRLVDELSDDEAERALALVEGEREDSVIAAFRDAPEDDEPFTAEDEAAIEEADEDIAAGHIVSHGVILRSAPPEDEEISAQEETAVKEARDEIAAGAPTIPLEEIKRKYGLA